MCFAGALPIAVQNAMKFSLAAKTSDDGGFVVTFVAVIKADLL